MSKIKSGKKNWLQNWMDKLDKKLAVKVAAKPACSCSTKAEAADKPDKDQTSCC